MRTKPIIQKLWMFMVMLCASVTASAFEVDGIAYSIESDNMVSVGSKSDKYSGSIVIPSEITYQDKIYNVASIDAMAFFDCNSLYSITIPNSVSQIGHSAFSGCKSLTNISLPDLIESIPEYCFASCSNLQSVKLPQQLKSIANNAFNKCSSLQTIDFPNSLQEIGEYAFFGCLLLNDISIPASVTNIPSGCFGGCRNLTDVELGNGIKRVDSFAFYTYSDIYIHFPPSIEYIDESVIYSGGIVLYRGNVKLGKQISGVNIAVLDSAFPTIIEKGNAHLYLVNPQSFLSSNNYSSSYVSSIGEYGKKGQEYIFWYDGTPQPLNNGVLNADSQLIKMGIEWYCSDFDVKDVGYYSGNAIIEARHNDWANSFPISYAFEILKAELTIHVNDCVKIYGDENPQFTFEANGFKANDNADTAINNIVFNTSATVNSEVGEYSITLSAESNNYNIELTEGLLKVTQAPLTVQVNDASREYGDSNPEFTMSFDGFKLNDDKTSAFSVMPTISTEANEISHIGTYPISASGGIAKNYNITGYKKGTLTITKAPLSLKANDASRIYGDDNPDFDFSLSGLKNNDDVSCIDTKPIYICLSTKTSDCGDYDIIPANAQAKDYEISYQKGNLTVTKAPLTLAASNLSREYGDPNPILIYEAVGLKGGDTAMSAITEEPILSTTANELSGVGQYSIIISEGAAKNYSLSYKSGVLTVTKAPLTVIAENAERRYGDNNPVFACSYLGLKKNDTETTAFSSLPRLSCAATKTSDVGNYPITVNGGTSRNYEIVAYEDGVLKITKAPLILTAINNSRLYFEDNPSFDYTLSGLRNSDTKSCLSVQPMFTCTATKTSSVGDYVIEPSGASATNYNIEYRLGTLSVNRRQLEASAGSYTRIYGKDNPEFEIVYTGFVNNEDKSALTVEANAICSAEKLSDVGTYPISVEGGSAINYLITQYNSGKLTITKADQTLIWNQNLSDIQQYSQIALEAKSSAGLPVTYEMSPNNVATLYNNNGIWYLDCFGTGAVNIRAVQNGDKNHNAAPMISKTLVVSGTGGDPSNPQIYLNVEEAGTLPSLIADNRKYQIKNLRLTGYLNGTDVNFLREMAGSDSYGNKTAGILETLDISGCTIVSGGRSYYKTCYTDNCKVSDYMFYNCKVLVNLMLPDNTTTIEDFAFADCDRLSVVSIPNDVKSFGNQSFRNDISLMRIPMPQSLTSIGDMAFMGCNGISDITLPLNVQTIGAGIVKDCHNISQINVESGNSNFASQNGVLYTYSLDELLIFPANHNSTNYTVNDGTQKIASDAFVNAKNLSNVILPSSLLSVGRNAFIGCVNLSTITVNALTPPICENDCFEDVSKARCELKVPKGCYSYYWVAPIWSEFNKIVEHVSSSIYDVSMDNIEVSVDGLNIMVTGTPNDIYVRIYQMNGLLIYQQRSNGEGISYQPATAGTYIIVVGNRTYKIMVK